MGNRGEGLYCFILFIAYAIARDIRERNKSTLFPLSIFAALIRRATEAQKSGERDAAVDFHDSLYAGIRQ